MLRGFSAVSNSAKRVANGFFKVLLLSSHLLISLHPIPKSKFGACAVTGYCSFKWPSAASANSLRPKMNTAQCRVFICH